MAQVHRALTGEQVHPPDPWSPEGNLSPHPHLYLMSNTVASSSSSSSSFSGAISTRSAGVVIMSYLRVFFNLLPNLEESHTHENTAGRERDIQEVTQA